MKNVSFFWNGEPCKVRFLYILIKPTECKNLAWWKPFEGTIRQVAEVTLWGDPFIIDNEDGLGYAKLTGGGMWTQGSRHYDSVNYDIVCDVKEGEIVSVFSKEKYDETEACSDAYWRQRKPDEFERLQKLKLMASNFKPFPIK